MGLGVSVVVRVGEGVQLGIANWPILLGEIGPIRVGDDSSAASANWPTPIRGERSGFQVEAIRRISPRAVSSPAISEGTRPERSRRVHRLRARRASFSRARSLREFTARRCFFFMGVFYPGMSTGLRRSRLCKSRFSQPFRPRCRVPSQTGRFSVRLSSNCFFFITLQPFKNLLKQFYNALEFQGVIRIIRPLAGMTRSSRNEHPASVANPPCPAR